MMKLNPPTAGSSGSQRESGEEQEEKVSGADAFDKVLK
jgi:hypothetical protein